MLAKKVAGLENGEVTGRKPGQAAYRRKMVSSRITKLLSKGARGRTRMVEPVGF